MKEIFSPKQLEFMQNAKALWNIAYGTVRSGKTVAVTYLFMQECIRCPDSKIYIVGNTFHSAKRNVIDLILNSNELAMFKPFVTWSGKKLFFRTDVDTVKEITILGASDEGCLPNFQGDTYSLVYCDEITTYPTSIIEMINSRLSKDYSRAFTTCNPTYPDHIIKKWIDKYEIHSNQTYYSLRFSIDDNPFIPASYKEMLRNSSTGIFYKRNYLGLWCMAEGAIYECFEKNIHVKSRAPRAAEYWICGIDYGASNPFAAVIVGVSTGIKDQSGKCLWIEDEYYWPHKEKRQKTNSELAEDFERFIENYGIKNIYIDPSAAAFKTELRKRGIACTDADNDVFNGISYTVSEMRKGNLYVLENCKNTIRELESYVWDDSKSKKGVDAPLKANDHLLDALRYCVYTHKVQTYQPYANSSSAEEYLNKRFMPTARKYS
jgi:PBSX family phage terminase large subunit